MRSLRNRLAVVFGLIVLGAIATVYLSPVPRLQDRPTQQKLEQLADDAAPAGKPALYVQPGGKPKTHTQGVNGVATRASAEVLLLRPLRNHPTGLSLITDSSENGGVSGGEISPVALEAFEAKRPRATTLNSGAGRQVIAAQPLFLDDKLVGV